MSKPTLCQSDRRLFALLIVAALSAVPACEGCDDKKAQKDTSQPAPEPDTSAKEDKKAEMLEEARQEAKKLGSKRGMSIYDKAFSLAGKFEAAQEEDEPDPPPRRQPIETGGKIDVAAVKKVFNQHANAARDCYERELKRDQSLSGRLILQVTIGTDGSVLRANAIGRSLQNERVNRCLERQAKGWTFPKPTGAAVKVNNPYTFSPKR